MAATGGETALNLPGPDQRVLGVLLESVPEIPVDWFDDPERWAFGINYLPWGADGVTADASDCEVVYDKQPDEMPDVVVQPAFLVYKQLQCSTLGPSDDTLARRVYEKLTVASSAEFASELETGSASGGVGLIGNATYVPSVESGSAVGLDVAFAALETHLAAVLHGGRGVIHLTPALLTLALADGLVEFREDSYRTATGHVVLGDAGHLGQEAPQGQSAAGSGQAWVYATGPVFYSVSPIDGVGLNGDAAADGSSQIYVARNKRRPLGERYGVIAFDPNTIGAALVSVGASDGGGAGGGGGGGGDASAANQTTIIGHVDGIETALTASNASLDAIEAANALATITKTTPAVGAIAGAETLHGFRLYNSHASDAVLIYIRHGNGAASTPVTPVAIAAGQSVNVFSGQRLSDGEPLGANGAYVTDESAGTATIADLVGYIATGAA